MALDLPAPLGRPVLSRSSSKTRANAPTRIGWLNRLRRALVRWFTRRPGGSRTPEPREVPARQPVASASSHADRQEERVEHHAGMNHRPDAPPPIAELEQKGDSELPSTLRASGQGGVPDKLATDREGPHRPADPAHGQAPADPADFPESSNHEPERDRGAKEHEVDAAEAATVSLPVSEAANVASDVAPTDLPPALGDSPPSGLPVRIADDADGDLQTPSAESDVSDSASHIPSQATEDINLASEAGSSSVEAAECNRGEDGRSERQQDTQSGNGDRSIQKYRPRLRPKATPAPTTAPSASQKRSEPTAGTLEAALLLTFLPGEWGISLSVLLSRADGMPERLDVRVGDERFPLYAIEEKLFEPIQPSRADLVGSGFSAEAEGAPVRRWVRTPRDLHTFSHRSGVSGFASVPRVLIGQENVVLCKPELAAVVEQCASATGSDPLLQVGGPGVPDGWLCFRGYRPQRPAQFEETDEIFEALNPLPDAAIDLSGGIASAQGKWIVGAPPVIRILGVPPGPGDLTIDGVEGTQSPNEGWTAPGWDSLGIHTIRFAGLLRTYEIVQIDETWPSWATSEDAALSACGARISAAGGAQAFAIRGGPIWLLGEVAGDLAFAPRTSLGFSIGAPRFRPVWAVSPLGSRRQTPASILPYRSEPRPPAASRTRREILQWCHLLRGAGAPLEADARELWREYRKLARSLRRKWR